MKALLISLRIACMVICVAVLCGCGDTRVQRRGEAEVLGAIVDDLYAKFLVGDVATARRCLLSAIDCISTNSTRFPQLTGALPIAYARLSLLERSVGNEAESKVAFGKARYWNLVEHERIGIPVKELAALVDQFTREESDKFADEWDKRTTKGAGPAYLSKRGGSTSAR